MAPRDRLSVHYNCYKVLESVTHSRHLILRCRLQCPASADGRLPIMTASHLVEHDVSLSNAAEREHLALYSLWHGLGGM